MSRSLLFILSGIACAGFLAFAPVSACAANTPKAAATAQDGIEIDIGKGRLIHLNKPATSVFIADPDVADVQVKSPSLVYLFGKAAGATNLYAVGEHDEVILNSEVHVRYDVTRLEQAIHDLVPRSAIGVSSVNDSLVISGTVYSAADGDDIRRIAAHFVPNGKQLLDKMKVDTPNQINLRVRMAEVSRDVIKQFGVDWENIANNGTTAFGLVTAGTSLLGGLSPNEAKVVPTLPGSSTFGFNTQGSSLAGGATLNNLFVGFRNGSKNINALISALDNHGLVTVLAEPNLSAISGEPAKFLAGGEFPVPVPAGLGTVGIDWKNFGVSLNFVATIIGNDRINLHVMPEVSELSNSGSIIIDSIQVPSLTTRRADTTVELASGQTFAIAGLLQNNITQQINKFPWLGDVPVLGQLFRSQAFQRNESELVILVTPYIVHPIATASQALTPTDGFVQTSDDQSITHADEFAPTKPKTPNGPLGPSGTSLMGPVGFSLE